MPQPKNLDPFRIEIISSLIAHLWLHRLKIFIVGLKTATYDNSVNKARLLYDGSRIEPCLVCSSFSNSKKSKRKIKNHQPQHHNHLHTCRSNHQVPHGTWLIWDNEKGNVNLEWIRFFKEITWPCNLKRCM